MSHTKAANSVNSNEVVNSLKHVFTFFLEKTSIFSISLRRKHKLVPQNVPNSFLHLEYYSNVTQKEQVVKMKE